MESDLIIPFFWMLVFGVLTVIGFQKLAKKKPVDKKWVRPEPEEQDSND